MFYGPDQAHIHDARFGTVARDAAAVVLGELHGAGTVVDLGCGSGIFSRAMADAGYTVVGVDISADMLDIARERVPEGKFTLGSVHDFAIPPAVAVVALGEVLNYAADTRAGLDALGAVAGRVREALDHGGLFVFDVATIGRGGGPGNTRDRFHDYPDWSLGMHSIEHRDGTLEREITVFVRDGERYRRVDELHVLRLYETADVTRLLEDAGFTVEVRGTYGEPADFPGWSVFVAHRH